MAHLSNTRLLSQPCEVLWAGFRSNTYVLQQAGWELAVEQDFSGLRLRLLIRNRDMQLYAVSDASSFDFYRNAHEHLSRPVFHIVQASSTMQLAQIVGFAPSFSFKQFDAAPQFSAMRYDNIEDLGIFAAPLVRTEELIVEPADVSALLEQIRRMQAPGQAEIRAKQRTRECTDRIPDARPMTRFHAQIITLDQMRNAA
jgi:hypothetical protein